VTSTDVILGRYTAESWGRTRRPSRFATGSQFAAYTGTAPIEVSSAERTRHRLSRAVAILVLTATATAWETAFTEQS
jgi:hypothetical protein